jgi:hypothetical protein
MTPNRRPDDTAERSPSSSDDPFAPLFAEHTELQVLAERMREVAASMERGESLAWDDVVEGLEVHRAFLIDLHERREEMVAEALKGLGGTAVQTALSGCRREHKASQRFQEAVRPKLSPSVRSNVVGKSVAAMFRTEADRMVEHHRAESERIYRPVRPSVPAEVRRALWKSYRSLDRDRGAAEARLSAWASKAHGSAD